MPKKSILVIDDDVAVRAMLCECLQDVGYIVSEAGDGEMGLQSMEKGLPDLVITDIIMPKKDGLETVKEIREKYPSVKVLAISGGGRAKIGDFLELARKLGSDAVLSKPIDIVELEKTVQTLIG